MARAKFSIGIDLGTTNCAMAFEALDAADVRTEVFEIPQWEKPGSRSESPTLPSFLYLPDAQEAAALGGAGVWVPGRFARKQSAEAPGRVVHSAKSWLCHHVLDRSAAFLPWDTDVLDPREHISPVQASAILLQYLRSVWDARYADGGAPFHEQEVTVTVPASFDPVAQRLTLEAAEQAGFPAGVRLVEEPQAAFYRWLEQHAGEEEFWQSLPAEGPEARHVVVIDIGGGTSDFSLFEVSRQSGSPLPKIRRVAVSDHLLLGGDNIDLAIAHRVAQGLPEGTELVPVQWSYLVARCRELKERCLGGEAEEVFTVSVPGRGSGLFGGTLSGRITREEIESILMNGFFPVCAVDAEPERDREGLREWALPYAADSAVTRYLTEFLRGRPAVDAVLFNGGSLHPEVLRRRLQEQIGAWQDGRVPVVLENPEPDLAVARGAARFGGIMYRRGVRIEAGAARAVYLEVEARGGGRRLVCILPRGSEAGEEFEISLPGLELTLGRRVRFQPHYSTRHGKDRAGKLVDWDPRGFHPLPPLQTLTKLAGAPPEGVPERLPVKLTASMNELGLLQVVCASADPRVTQAWPLEFNLRPHEDAQPVAAPETGPDIEPEILDTARQRIVSFFRAAGGKEKPTANKLLKQLEEVLGMPKQEWGGMLIRALWPALYECYDRRSESPDHEEAWLIMAGYLLRPGFGAGGDAARIDQLWRVHEDGPAHPGKRIALQYYITWRRVAGGLDRERQEAVLKPELPKLAGKKAPAELVRLAGALERLDPALKTALAGDFTARGKLLGEDRKYAAPWFVALGLLLNRAPFYAGPAGVLPPERVEATYAALRDLDWSQPELAEIPTLFLRAARVVDDPVLDLPKNVRAKIASKLEDAGMAVAKVERVRTFVAVESADQAGLFGESLPAGLVLDGKAGR